MSSSNLIDDRITALPDQLNLKARSLLMSIWGDSIAPHGGTIWLGSLINLAESFGLNERVIRTSVFRLKQEKLLSSKQEGRRSFYTLAQTGQHRFEEATKRIYSHQIAPWNGEWTLLFTERRELSDDKKRQLKMELGWLGFGDLGSGLFAHPNSGHGSIKRILVDLDIEKHVAIMRASGLPDTEETPIHILVQKGWDLADIESGYTEFIAHFAPLLKRLSAEDTLDNKKCFILRTLLVHDYRRALLKDPMLPGRLLPEVWNGDRAKMLFRSIYLLIWERAEEFLIQNFETETGKPPEATNEFKTRFGGLMRQGETV